MTFSICNDNAVPSIKFCFDSCTVLDALIEQNRAILKSIIHAVLICEHQIKGLLSEVTEMIEHVQLIYPGYKLSFSPLCVETFGAWGSGARLVVRQIGS